jgi:homogentisate 1,2-dioxygenase
VESEAIKGALPRLGNAPQKVAYGLYAEQVSGTAFTAPRHKNQRAWLYRIKPSVNHLPFAPYAQPHVISSFHAHSPEIEATPQQLRWDPLELTLGKDKDFVDGLVTLGGAGDSQVKDGMAIHFYSCNLSMNKRAFYNSDGDFLIGEAASTCLLVILMNLRLLLDSAAAG